MSALEHGSSPIHNDESPLYTRDDYAAKSSSEDDTPNARGMLGPPQTGKRSGSLSSGSQLALAALGNHCNGNNDHEDSPDSNETYTSPESQSASEQLAFFKDYYSQDEIHPSNLVSALWAYEPRAADEFHLDRGDMIKIIGIWDDGWATGVRVRQRAEDWRPTQRDSGVTQGSQSSPESREGEGEVKAFPLVCVCLPQHYKRTVEGESTGGSGPPFP